LIIPKHTEKRDSPASSYFLRHQCILFWTFEQVWTPAGLDVGQNHWPTDHIREPSGIIPAIVEQLKRPLIFAAPSYPNIKDLI